MLKLNLGCGGDVRNHEYVNVDLDARDLPPEIYRQGDATSLDWLCEDGTADEIMALNLLPFIRLADIDRAIEEWIKKLVVGGVLKFSAPCLRRIAKDFIDDRIDLTAALAGIFGMQEGDQFAKSGVDMQTMRDRLEGSGMRVTSACYVDTHTFMIEAVKLA